MLDVLFGELRSYLHQADVQDDHELLWALLAQAYELSPHTYHAQWIPYLAQFKLL